MADSTSIRLVCFDLGGVLLRICRSWREGCAAAGLEARAAFPDDPSAANGFKGIGASYQVGALSCTEYAGRFAAAMNHLYSPDEIMTIHHAWLLGEYPGAGLLIDDLHAAGLETACLSNTNHAHWSRMPEYASVMKLQRRFASHELGHAKPDAAIYRAFEERTGRSAGEIVFFDDLPENVAAARALGWRATVIDPAGDPAAQMRSALRRCNIV